MQGTFKAFISRVIKRYEGGYVWDKDDPGGPTNFGVTCYALAAHRGQKMHSMAAWAPIVRELSLAEAVDIYEKKYAAPIAYARLPAGVDTTLLDYAINSGHGRANRVARRIAGLEDGTRMTTEVVDALSRRNAADVINAICDERLRFMKAIRGGTAWAKYKRGWSARVADLRAYSLALAAGTSRPKAPDLSSVPTPKAEVPKPGKTVETVSSGLGGLVTTVLGYLTDLPWLWIAGGLVVVVLIGVGIAVYRDVRAAKEDKVYI